jgi:hypothetical protein
MTVTDERMLEARLGCATNEDMLRELICRFKMEAMPGNISSLMNIERALTLAEMLGSMGALEREYRTVDAG